MMVRRRFEEREMKTAGGETGGQSRQDGADHSEEGIKQEPVSAEGAVTHKPGCSSPLNDGSRCFVSLQSRVGTKLSVLTLLSLSLPNDEQPSLLIINWLAPQILPPTFFF